MTLSEPAAALAASVQQTRLIAAGLALAVLWAVESVAPMYVGRRRRVSHGAANLGLAAVNAAVSAVFAFAVVDVTERARVHGFGLLHQLDLAQPGRGVLAFVLVDCWQYWWHRANHRVPFLWRFHAVHHADAELDVTSGVRFHAVEITLSFVARLAVLPLLGVTVPELVLYEAVALPIVLFHHANLGIPSRLDGALRRLVVTPRMHYVHHSRLQPETDSNYASVFSFWDRLFRSFRFRERSEEIDLGLDGWREPEWRTLPGMLAAPFRRAVRG